MWMPVRIIQNDEEMREIGKKNAALLFYRRHAFSRGAFIGCTEEVCYVCMCNVTFVVILPNFMQHIPEHVKRNTKVNDNRQRWSWDCRDYLHIYVLIINDFHRTSSYRFRFFFTWNRELIISYWMMSLWDTGPGNLKMSRKRREEYRDEIFRNVGYILIHWIVYIIFSMHLHIFYEIFYKYI